MGIIDEFESLDLLNANSGNLVVSQIMRSTGDENRQSKSRLKFIIILLYFGLHIVHLHCAAIPIS